MLAERRRSAGSPDGFWISAHWFGPLGPGEGASVPGGHVRAGQDAEPKLKKIVMGVLERL